MSWWDIVKFDNKLGQLLEYIKHHHTTSIKQKYVPQHELGEFIKLYGKFTRMLKDPNINLNNLDRIADPMESYYSKLVGAPEFHHQEFGSLYTAVFDELRNLKSMEDQGYGA